MHNQITFAYDWQSKTTTLLSKHGHDVTACEIYKPKNAWMPTDHFMEWFHNDFVPHVKKILEALGEKSTAVLLLDNCSAHPDPEDLVSCDGAIFAKFLPPNVTSLIQPMDQGVIESLKRRYKSKLLRKLIIEDEVGMSAIEFLKGINLQ